VTLPEMIAGCRGNEEPEVYPGKTALVTSCCLLFAWPRAFCSDLLSAMVSSSLHRFLDAWINR